MSAGTSKSGDYYLEFHANEVMQEDYLNDCIRSKTLVDICFEHNHIYACRILAHDCSSILVELGEKEALIYKSAVQAIVPEEGHLQNNGSGQLLADVRAQYMRYLAKNRAARPIKGN